jgi:hypothetical protein
MGTALTSAITAPLGKFRPREAHTAPTATKATSLGVGVRYEPARGTSVEPLVLPARKGRPERVLRRKRAGDQGVDGPGLP